MTMTMEMASCVEGWVAAVTAIMLALGSSARRQGALGAWAKRNLDWPAPRPGSAASEVMILGHRWGGVARLL